MKQKIFQQSADLSSVVAYYQKFTKSFLLIEKPFNCDSYLAHGFV